MENVMENGANVPNPNEDEKINQPGTPPGEEGGNEKTFTQEELDLIVKERLSRERKKYPTAQELQGYNEYKKTQMPAGQNVDNTILESAQKELANSRLELDLYKAQAKPEYVEFMIYELAKQDITVQEFKKQNPQYFGENVVKKVSSSVRLGGEGQSSQTTNEYINNLFRGGQ